MNRLDIQTGWYYLNGTEWINLICVRLFRKNSIRFMWKTTLNFDISMHYSYMFYKYEFTIHHKS